MKRISMKYIKNFDIEYVDSSLQYASVDFEENDIIDAEYIKVSGFEGQPDIEALPKPPLGTKAVNEGTYIPSVLTNEEASKQHKIYGIRFLRFPMTNQGDINKRIHDGLLFSYSNRSYAYSERPIEIKTKDGKDNITINIFTSTRMCGKSNSTGLIGLPGTGKSTALTIALENYPRAIKHNVNGDYYIQIPIIRTTAYANSNLSALFISFANAIDEILDTGTKHRDDLKGNIGKNAEEVISWIKRYHIGCWIIEEAEFFSFNTASNGSFENIVTIMQETGIFLFATGNPDLIDKISGNLRLERRLLANYIDMDLIHQDKKFMKSITTMMWNFLLPEIKTELTEEMFNEIYHWTLGSIDMISILLIALQQEFEARRRKREKLIKLNKDFIREVGKAKLTRMRKLFLDGNDKLAINEYYQAQNEFEISINKELQIVENANIQAEIEQDIIVGYNHTLKFHMVKNSIENYTDDYSEKQIKKAFCFCEENIDSFKRMKEKEMIRTVKQRLESIKSKNTEKISKKVNDNFDDLQNELFTKKQDT